MKQILKHCILVATLMAVGTPPYAAERKAAESNSSHSRVSAAQTQPISTQLQAPIIESVQPSVLQPAGPSDIAAGEQIKWWVIAAGGGSSSSATYKLNQTVGQTAAGLATSASYKLNQGFWQSSGGCCIGTRGNVNMAGIIDVSDLSLLVAYLTASPAPALPCEPAANVNSLGIVDVSDLSLLVAYLTASPAPALPACP